MDEIQRELNIYAFMQISISYRQTEEEIFERLKRNRFGKQTEDD
jgi:hypothetical protein